VKTKFDLLSFFIVHPLISFYESQFLSSLLFTLCLSDIWTGIMPGFDIFKKNYEM
jgi:hypothetical protein